MEGHMDDQFDDTMFDTAAVEAGAWAPGPYGPDDELGTFNEVTPDRTARALAMLDLSRPVRTYRLAETMREGYPAWGDRSYSQRLVVTGYEPEAGFAGELTDPLPQGPGRSSVIEERVAFSFNMGTKVNGLQHIGVAGVHYNGFRAPEITRTWGTTRLGAQSMAPIVTRGVLVDVLGWALAAARSDALDELDDGRPHLRANYRITVEDIVAALDWAGVAEPIGPGDAVLIRTGWRELIDADPDRYLEGGPPGPFRRECRWLAARRPALVGSDTWCFEVLDPSLTEGFMMTCHQELFTRHGIRIAEAVPTDELARDGVYEFVFALCPYPALGAVSSISPPLALGQ